MNSEQLKYHATAKLLFRKAIKDNHKQLSGFIINEMPGGSQ